MTPANCMKNIIALIAAAVLGASASEVVVLRTVVTNHIPGYISGPEPKVKADGFYEPSVPAVAIVHQPRTEVVTNFVIKEIEVANTAGKTSP